MQSLPEEDWDPRAPEVLADPLRAYDALRGRCPVARSDYLNWSVFRHADVVRVLHAPEVFGNGVSRHASIPNGMDAPEHTPWRALVERYFTPARVAAFQPVARAVARACVQALPEGELEWMDAFAQDCAVRLLCAFMQWPAQLHAPLRDWMRRSQAATLAGDREALGALAREFDGHIRGQLDARRAQAQPSDDPTSRLLRDEIDGRPLRDEEIVSIVRNWTAGELSTLAASLGILAHYLAAQPELQQRLRAQPALLRPAIDEILRIHPPLLSNRRVVRQPACVAGRAFVAGERLTLMWASANRDEAVFGDPDAFRIDRDPALNLLYGAGVHVCPGAELSRVQLGVALEEVLAGTRRLAPVAGRAPVPARYPVGGWSEIMLAVS
ncbi:cytochrome P450 [Ramlibacter alkalitolerans]|uniref:Cytochrome P450 n=1 Tax=Ramlibacter alkalitolerans TaxID=2039631 RepID=A0ABS1JJ18_9BURK|nr:cytochrome P450 [Ramlibacter alkalitolerans]MBL0424218.1 cytochrome P450 [Ramlibacter alkalitolerans]